MIRGLISILRGKKERGITGYAGFSDFFLHAPADEKKKVITEAARKANEDQLKVFNEAHLKVTRN